jgi:hypothetical protein
VITIPLQGTGDDLLDESVRRDWAARFKALLAEDLVLDCLRPFDVLGSKNTRTPASAWPRRPAGRRRDS